MRYLIPLVLFITLVSGCSKQKNINKVEASQSQQIIEEINTICNEDNGNLWGFNLLNNVLLINPETKQVYTNIEAESLSKYKEIFIGNLADNVLIDNRQCSAFGKNWSMFTLPLPADSAERSELIIEQLFASHQSKIGIDKLETPDCNHLNKPDIRVWMKIEVEALKEALKTNDPTAQKEHIKMAVSARKMRSMYVGEMFSRENITDLKIGIPTLNQLLFNKASIIDKKKKLYNELDEFQRSDNFMRSFPYLMLPSYGLLMSQESTDWLKKLNHETDLITFITNHYGFEYERDFMQILNDLKSKYNGSSFDKEERIRTEKLRNEGGKYKSKFLESPFVFIKINDHTIINSNPETVFPLEDKGMIHKTLSVNDIWGSIKVTDGALINKQRSYLYISAPFEMNGNVVKGADWEMTLNKDYTIKPYNNTDKFIVTKK